MTFPANGIPGIDVSHYQGVVDWAAVAASGEQFAFAKASEGISVADLYFHDNWAAINPRACCAEPIISFTPTRTPQHRRSSSWQNSPQQTAPLSLPQEIYRPHSTWKQPEDVLPQISSPPPPSGFRL